MVLVCCDGYKYIVYNDAIDYLDVSFGNNTLVFDFGSGQDTVYGFDAGAASDDIIDLTALGLVDTGGDGILNDLAISQSGSNTIIDLGSGNTITLANVDMGDLHEDDFVF